MRSKVAMVSVLRPINPSSFLRAKIKKDIIPMLPRAKPKMKALLMRNTSMRVDMLSIESNIIYVSNL